MLEDKCRKLRLQIKDKKVKAKPQAKDGAKQQVEA
jgi:hypothetical protein